MRAPDAGELAPYDAAQLERETDAGASASDASTYASDDAGDASAPDAGADSSVTAPPPVVLSQESYTTIWHDVLASRCFDCHTNLDRVAPVIDLDFGVGPLLRTSSCNGMPYVTPGDPSRSLIWRAFTDAPCGPHRKLSEFDRPLQPVELDMIAAWIRGELEP